MIVAADAGDPASAAAHAMNNAATAMNNLVCRRMVNFASPNKPSN
jgi:hypothetical protein